MAKRELPDPELLRKLLRYEAETGKLFWRERPCEMFPSKQSWKTWNTKHANSEALKAKDAKGYKHGQVLNKHYMTHRVVWALVHGAWPNEQIDHINGDKSDNRIFNLRDVSHAVNAKNLKKSAANTSGSTGVSWMPSKKCWRAEICVDGRRMHIGVFKSLEEAKVARADADARYGFHENHGRD